MEEYTIYEHHGVWVAVHNDLKGMHKEHCLCYSCALFHPGEQNNCPIAEATYEHNCKYGITTPVWECPDFRRLPST